jgi:DNA polymerase III subunit alpha
MSALALTDNGNLYGAIEFYKSCRGADIKPIIGVDFYVATRTRHDKQAGLDNRRYRLVLLAKDLTGYRNLISLVTASYLEGFYYKPRIDKELLDKYKEGLIAISPSYSGEVSVHLRNQEADKAKECVLWYGEKFGKDNFYIEITHQPGIEGHQASQEGLVKFARANNIPIVAGHDIFYLSPDDKKARDTLLSVQSGGDVQDRFSVDDKEDFSFVSPDHMENNFKRYPDAIGNSYKIAEMCDLELELGRWVFPEIEIPEGSTYDEELKKQTYEGIKRRGLKRTPEVLERIEYELEIIKNKGYAGYFLIVGDLMKYAHSHDILTTIRGSVAGSLVTYLCGITTVNPLEYRLPFERFLNPERPSAPDIDMDFADNRRDEVIAYAKTKYGEDKVAQIGTFGTMMAKGSVRDVARALGYPYETGDMIARLIPLGSQGFPMTIARAMEMEPELKKMYDKDNDVKEIIDIAKKVEGCARHISVHAAGVVISPEPLSNYVPVQFDPKGGKKITQFDMHAVEDAGLVKFDFLGIKNLAILADAVKLAKRFHDVDIDIEALPLNDKKTFEMLARGETMGLFQLNGSGMTRFLKELKPSSINDINAMVALYRPGPMESIPEYIKRKHNPLFINYLDPRLEEILSSSHGVLTYQDDVLLISIKLAGYSWLEADKLRKAMGKKIPEEMEAQKEKLLDGLIKGGMSRTNSLKMWHLIEPFAAYGFNKAHAASYGRVAYQTAYMKANYPIEYMCAILTADSGDVEKIAEIISECDRMKIKVLPPDINQSFGNFTVVKGEDQDRIRFGLYSIKNFGEGIARAIIIERKENGPFTSLSDFLIRIKDKNLNKKSLEALIKCGALDEFGERGEMLHNLSELLLWAKDQAKNMENQQSLFGLMSDNSSVPELRLDKCEPSSVADMLAWEKELLGLYVTGHPLDKYADKFKARKTNIKRIKEELSENMVAVVSGIIEEAKEIMTKKGDKMMFLKVSDMTGTMEAVIFPKVLVEFRQLLVAENCVAIRGRISHRNGTVSVVAEKVKAL